MLREEETRRGDGQMFLRLPTVLVSNAERSRFMHGEEVDSLLRWRERDTVQ